MVAGAVCPTFSVFFCCSGAVCSLSTCCSGVPFDWLFCSFVCALSFSFGVWSKFFIGVHPC
ncbi:hypothetical protein [Staphylococcus cohnii]|nr:hypothetical protein [Staphylococcus cohnii]